MTLPKPFQLPPVTPSVPTMLPRPVKLMIPLPVKVALPFTVPVPDKCLPRRRRPCWRRDRAGEVQRAGGDCRRAGVGVRATEGLRAGAGHRESHARGAIGDGGRNSCR